MTVFSYDITILQDNKYLFSNTDVKKMKWTLPLTICHFQPRVTEGHEGLEMAPSERLRPLNRLKKPVELNNDLFLMFIISFQLRKLAKK